MSTVVTLTMNPAVDKSAVTSDVVAEHKLRCHTPRREPGGGGINVARALQTLGTRATAIFPAGGPTGDMLTRVLADEAVPHKHVPTAAWTRENLTIFEESTDQQYRFGMPGPELQAAEWQACLDHLARIDSPAYLVASGSLPPSVPSDFYARVSRLARERGARLLLDTSGEPLRAAAAEGVYLLKPNAREFAQLTEEPFESEQQQETLARQLVARGACEILVLSLGAAGILLATADGIRRLRSPAVPIRSKVGAGDSMMAGLTHGLVQGQDLLAVARLGVAAGAAAVMTPGTELCRREDVEQLTARLAAAKDA
jgi:6-phosphofructokinase 2